MARRALKSGKSHERVQTKLENLEKTLQNQKNLAEPLEDKKSSKKITKKEADKLRHLHLIIDEQQKNIKIESKKSKRNKI